MIKRLKKRAKPTEPEIETLVGEGDSGLGNPSRNVLAALDQRIAELERGNRSRKQRTIQSNQNTCSSQRPNSVPSKTVSFSPYIRHRENDDVPAERHVSKCTNKCSYCNIRGRRSTLTTSPCRQRFAVRKANYNDNEVSYASPNSFSDSPEFYTDVSNSPGPARYRDFSGSAGDYKHSWRSDTARSIQSDDRDLSSASAYYNKRFGWVYPCSHSSKITSRNSCPSSDVSTSTSDDMVRFRAHRLSNCLSSEDVWRQDSRIDRLLAKYSDYSYPKQHSPPVTYFPYKSSFLESLLSGKSSYSKSILSKLDLLNSSLSARRQRISSSLPCSYMTMIHRYKDFSEPVDYMYNSSMNCANDPSAYSTLGPSIVTTSDPLLEHRRFPVYRNDYPMLSNITGGRSEMNVKAKFDRWIKPWFDKQSSRFQSKFSSLLLGRPLGLSNILSKKPVTFLDDVKLQEKFHTVCRKASMPERPSRQTSKGSLGFQYDPGDNNLSYLPCQTVYGRSSRNLQSYTTAEADSVFNYNLNSSRSVGSDLALQPNYSTNDISKRPSSTINASRASFGSSMHSLDSLFSASTKHCATNSGYISLLKFEKSYLDKYGVPNIHLGKCDGRLQPVQSESDTGNARCKEDDKCTAKVNVSSNCRNN